MLSDVAADEKRRFVLSHDIVFCAPFVSFLLLTFLILAGTVPTSATDPVMIAPIDSLTAPVTLLQLLILPLKGLSRSLHLMFQLRLEETKVISQRILMLSALLFHPLIRDPSDR